MQSTRPLYARSILHGRRFELGGSGFWIGCVDRQHVGRDVIVEVRRHEDQACAQAVVDPDRRRNRPAPRAHAYALALANAVACGIFGRNVETLAAPQRRRIAAALHAGIERIQAPAGRQAQRKLVVERFDRRVVVDRRKRRARLPESGLPTVARASIFRPDAFRRSRATECRRVSPTARNSCPRATGERVRHSSQIVSARQSPQSCPKRRASAYMISESSRASPGGSSALRTRCTRRSLLVTVPSLSHQLDAAGSTTSASSPVFVRKMSCTIRHFELAEQPRSRAFDRLRTAPDFRRSRRACRVRRVPSHRTFRSGSIPARKAGSTSHACSNFARICRIGDALAARILVGERAHVAAALHVILSAQRADARTVAADVPGQQREVDQRAHVVDRVVMFGDAERPAELRARAPA